METIAEKHVNLYKESQRDKGRLLISCPDKKGIVAAVSDVLFKQGANILESNQYSTDSNGGTFFMRIEFECPDLADNEKKLKEEFLSIANKFKMKWDIIFNYHIKKTAIFVSKELHCLRELLWEWQSGDLMTEIPIVISNHLAAKELVESLHIPFYYIPVSKETKEDAELRQKELLDKHQIDLIVLARYMQILSPSFVEMYENKIINIHHSFLPAFMGARPYERAFARGVKLIGATSHYVTDDLDEGPIIEQDIMRVNHQDNIQQLKKIGQSIERNVLSKAVKWHLQDRIIVQGNKTIVF
ncbi:formyltetrahydrofolate deformylase [Pradoshia sp. D12]|uniref:formyltetrahydrofolate deformylase n=1 Tax=Bacillaceae TaxID=186817 RepID=UPI00080ACB6E|nr:MULTISPECIES: formyltetrahydrofolate deformylase [Bacillaceae]OCA81147.1 formyltetrahydrofolate deformylase [Bacillus sp. FJAT-27986]QFK73079.1 formyltetrahydrofolate deformylase [Pradoshia sp. D12]TPF72071.1 formyltetrahydrofolate deformylase [Bacillus sp. D12]